MNRWWADVDAARDVLDLVDGSDVVQGVGSATLGLHALHMAALAPLAAETLVDAARVAEVLEQVDPTPVARAIAAATEPVMGEAAAPYGVMLAAELHAQAAAGTQAMVTQLTAAGIPMPTALERVSHVAGVPAGYAGQFTQAMKAPTVSDIVAADAADRVLMTYASAKGHLEARGDAPSDVSKGDKDGGSGAAAAAFDESEHPRDGEGKFAVKVTVETTPPRLARQRRRARRARREGREQRASAQAPKAKAADTSLSGLAALIRPSAARGEAARGQAARGEVTRALAARGKAARGVAARGEPATPPGPPAWAIDAPWGDVTPQSGDLVELNDQDAQLLWVTHDLFNEIMAAKTLTMGHLMLHPGAQSVFESQRDLLEEPPLHFLSVPDMMLIRITGKAPVTHNTPPKAGSHGVGDVTFANRARFNLVRPPEFFDFGQDEEDDPTAAGQIPVLNLEWNGDYDNFPEERWSNQGWAASLPWSGGKADEVWADAAHHQVDRDEEGQFAVAGGARAARMARRARRARREGHAARAAQAKQQADTSLSGLAGLVRPPAARGEAVRGEAARGQAARGEAARGEAERGEAGPGDRTQEFERLQVWEMREDDARLLMSSHFDSVSSGDKTLTFHPTPRDLRGRMPEFKALKPSDAIRNWRQKGSGTPERYSDVGTLQEAKVIAARINAARTGQYAKWERSAYVVDRHNGIYDVISVKYDPGTEPVFFIGEDDAMESLYHGDDEALQFSLAAYDSHELAEVFHANPKIMGNHPVPLVAITVAFPDDDKYGPGSGHTLGGYGGSRG